MMLKQAVSGIFSKILISVYDAMLILLPFIEPDLSITKMYSEQNLASWEFTQLSFMLFGSTLGIKLRQAQTGLGSSSLGRFSTSTSTEFSNLKLRTKSLLGTYFSTNEISTLFYSGINELSIWCEGEYILENLLLAFQYIFM